MKRKEDLRVRKTKLNLYNGLIKLMEEKSFEDIKVTDICNKALVNRSTFYDHFNDKYELYQAYIKYLGNSFDESLKLIVPNNSINDYYISFIELLIDEINSNINNYKVIFNTNYNSYTMNMLINTSITSITKYLKENFDFNDWEYVKFGVLFYVSGTISIISECLKNNNLLDKDVLTDYFKTLIPLFDRKKK